MMRSIGANIFAFNETHGNDLNPLKKKVLQQLQHRVWKRQQGFSHIQTSSSKLVVTAFTKAGGNMVGISGDLCFRVRDQIDDDNGRWCGFTLLGKDGCKILVLTVYNVSQDYNTSKDTLYQQQKQFYLSDYHMNGITEDKNNYTHPKKRFINDIRTRTLLENAKAKKPDIILTGDFNEDVGENYNKLTQLIFDMELIDVHAYKHGFDCDIATWARGYQYQRLNYFFLS